MVVHEEDARARSSSGWRELAGEQAGKGHGMRKRRGTMPMHTFRVDGYSHGRLCGKVVELHRKCYVGRLLASVT